MPDPTDDAWKHKLADRALAALIREQEQQIRELRTRNAELERRLEMSRASMGEQAR